MTENMTMNKNQFCINATLAMQPQLKAIINALDSSVNSYYISKGISVPQAVEEEFYDYPLLFIASKRMRDAWNHRGAHLTLNGAESGFHSTSYLTWCGENLSFAIDTMELEDVFGDGLRLGQVLVMLVAETVMTLDSFDVDDDFTDFLYVADQARRIPRFVPDATYLDLKMAGFPSLIRDDEQRFLGQNGEPVYLAMDCNSATSSNQSQLQFE